MRTLDNYIGRNILIGTAVTLAVLLVLIGFFELINQLEYVGEGDFTTSDALIYVFAVLPRMLYEIFPVVVLLGSLIGLGALASHSELTAMRATGVSLSRIILSVLRVGLLGIVIVVIIGEFIAPASEQYAEQMKMEKISKHITLKSRYGFWSRDGNTYINIRQILPGARLRNIFIYEFSDDHRLLSSTHAVEAEYIDDHWQLSKIRRSDISEERIESRRFPSAAWNSMLNPRILDVVVAKPNMLPIWDLYDYIGFMKSTGQEVMVYEVAFWGKLMMPLMTLIMVFLAVPFVFGILRTVGIGQRVFFGALVGLGFFLLNRVFSHMAVVFELDPFTMSSLPVLIFLAAGLWYTRRIL